MIMTQCECQTCIISCLLLKTRPVLTIQDVRVIFVSTVESPIPGHKEIVQGYVLSATCLKKEIPMSLNMGMPSGTTAT